MAENKPFNRSGVQNAFEEKPDVRVVKLEEKTGAIDVKPFEFSAIEKTGGDYQKLKARYGPLAATDVDRRARTPKDSRFSLNPVLRDRLAIEEEERRAIQARVDARVEEELNALREKARVEGYAAGAAEGKQEAFEKFRKEGAERIGNLDRLLAAFEGAREEIYHANERFLIELVYRIARMVLLKELATDSELVVRLAKLLIERVGVRENIKIRIHPEEKVTLNQLKDQLDQFFGGLKNLSIEPSSRVQAGGCLIETDWNIIDASIETQLKGIYAGLIGETEK